ncbi:arylamine N-acetyltransferase family protein [Saccharopolyspora sp. NPDC002578]
MFDVDTYLRRLGTSGPLEPTVESLRVLHKAHLTAIPYDNTTFPEHGGPLPRNLADVGIDPTFDKIVVRGLGGICFELNLLLQRLLDESGFDTISVSAGVLQDGGRFSPDLSHRFVIVRLGQDRWLADVGFSGPSFLEPLRLVPDVQEQYGCGFRLIERGDRYVLERRSRGGDWRPVYRFTLRPRRTEDWDGFTETLQRFLAESAPAGTTMMCRATGDGHRMIVGRRHLVVADGHERLSALVDPAEFDRAVAEILRG